MQQTHENYINQVRDIALNYMGMDDTGQSDFRHRNKLVYGAGNPGTRGITYYERWENGHGPDEPACFIEICAFGESDPVQLAGTVIHEMAHALAGPDAGHSGDWKAMCRSMGLGMSRDCSGKCKGKHLPAAAGQRYSWALFAPSVRHAIAALSSPTDGKPMSSFSFSGLPVSVRPCGAGHGSRGGKSRGTGSGSRMKKYTCQCDKPVIIRHAGTELDATCNHCSSAFEMEEK